LNVAIDTRHKLPVACFIGHDQPDRADGMTEWFSLDLCIAHADLLLTLDGHDEFV
jgi:hypothetical protein